MNYYYFILQVADNETQYMNRQRERAAAAMNSKSQAY
jgi:hypothetical protein